MEHKSWVLLICSPWFSRLLTKIDFLLKERNQDIEWFPSPGSLFFHQILKFTHSHKIMKWFWSSMLAHHVKCALFLLLLFLLSILNILKVMILDNNTSIKSDTMCLQIKNLYLSIYKLYKLYIVIHLSSFK